jgi:hypothetical protein
MGSTNEQLRVMLACELELEGKVAEEVLHWSWNGEGETYDVCDVLIKELLTSESKLGVAAALTLLNVRL